MKTVQELNLGFSDAQNYLQRSNKKMLSEVFVKNAFLDKLLRPSTYYLIGEKGTGKTAYAAFLSNFERNDHKSFLKYINGTDYEIFHQLKKKQHLDISGYVDIWKTILLLLLAKSISDNRKLLPIWDGKSSLSKLMTAIDEYYSDAFSPEVSTAVKIIDNSEIAAKLISKHMEAEGKKGNAVEYNEQRLQINLQYIIRNFSRCLGSLKLKKNITMFLDGIDVRPNLIPYGEYLDCIKGLANACWTLNTEVFANTRDSGGQLKIVLLLRPDIFNNLNLQNATNKVRDNAVYLDWRTTYNGYPKSTLFEMAKKLLAFSQSPSDKNIDSIWDDYFDWKLPTSNESREYDTAFMAFLRISLSRPRDIQVIVSLLQEQMIEQHAGNMKKFSQRVFESDEFQNKYSQFFMGSLKDQLSFYYSEQDYKDFGRIFDYFKSPKFTLSEFETKYEKYANDLKQAGKELPIFAEGPRSFLQLLYDSNIIVAIEEDEKGVSYRLSYREKSLSNIVPDVPYGEGISYRFHYGLYKVTKMGRF